MSIKISFKKKPILILALITCLIAVGVPSGVYAYNMYNFNKYFNNAKQLISEDNLEAAKENFNMAAAHNSKKNSDIQENIKTIETIKKSKLDFEASLKLMEDKKYLEAIEGFKKVSTVDTLRYESTMEKIKEVSGKYVSEHIDKAVAEAAAKKYNLAIAALEELIKFDSSNKEAPELKNQYESEMNKIKEAEQKELADKQRALEEAKKAVKVTTASNTQTKASVSKNNPVSSPQPRVEPTVSVRGDVMTINDNGKKINVQFHQMPGFYYINYGVSSNQIVEGTPGLPIELDYKITFKHPYGEEVVHGKTTPRPSSNGPLVDLPLGNPITATIEVTYKQKTYSFTTGFSTRGN